MSMLPPSGKWPGPIFVLYSQNNGNPRATSTLSPTASESNVDSLDAWISSTLSKSKQLSKGWRLKRLRSRRLDEQALQV